MNELQLFDNGESELRREKQRARYRQNAGGSIYAIQFSTGIVKVGRTNNLDKRLADHNKSARSHGVSVSRSWGSGPHARYEGNEVKLIAFCSDRWPIAGGREYFRDADFGEVVSFAKSLPMARLTDADIDADIARSATAPSLVDAFKEAVARLEQSEDEPGRCCPWFAQFQKSRDWFEAEFPDGGYAPVHVGRRAWAALPARHKAAALDIFFNDYWRRLQNEAEEDRQWRESGAYDAELAELSELLGGAS